MKSGRTTPAGCECGSTALISISEGGWSTPTACGVIQPPLFTFLGPPFSFSGGNQLGVGSATPFPFSQPPPQPLGWFGHPLSFFGGGWSTPTSYGVDSATSLSHFRGSRTTSTPQGRIGHLIYSCYKNCNELAIINNACLLLLEGRSFSLHIYK